MDEDELINLSNVLRSDYGVDTILCILKKLGAFERDINRAATSKEDYLTWGKREKGQWLLDCVRKVNTDVYLEILKRAERNSL